MDSRSAQDGFDEALASLSGRLDLLLQHLAGPALRRRIDAEDLAQDTLVRLLGSSQARELRGADLWAFAQRTARNVVIDAARRARLAPRRSASVAGAPSVDGSATRSVIGTKSARGPGPRTLVAAGEQHARLVAAFQSLDPEYRRVLGLRRFQGLSARETARRMGRSETAVHSLFRRALEAWSKEIEGPAANRAE